MLRDKVITVKANNKDIKRYKVYDNYNNLINVEGVCRNLSNDAKAYYIGLENTDIFNNNSNVYMARTRFVFNNNSIEDIKNLRFGKIKIIFDKEYSNYIEISPKIKIGKNKFCFDKNSVEIKFTDKLRYNEVYKYARIIKYLFSYFLGYNCHIAEINYFIKDSLICEQHFSKAHVFSEVINSIKYYEKKKYINEEGYDITEFSIQWIRFLSSKYAVSVLNSLGYVYNAYSYDDLEKQIQETVILMDGFFNIVCDEYEEHISSKIVRIVNDINLSEKNKKVNTKILKLLKGNEIRSIVDIRGAKSHAGGNKKEHAKELRRLLANSMFTLEVYLLLSILENKDIDIKNNKKTLKKVNRKCHENNKASLLF